MVKVFSVLSQDDIATIKEAIRIAKANDSKAWNQEILNPVKRKLKDNMRALLEDRCCYCCKNTFGEYNLVLDIEHILPKSKYKRFEFSPFNLSVACKRCNMEIKGFDISFLRDKQLAETTPLDSNNYRIIHPNLDDYFAHLQYEVLIVNSKKMVKYITVENSEKGNFTYRYFKLDRLEVDSFNETQGVSPIAKHVSAMIPEDITKEIESLLK